jgi:hypothetical protein
VKQLTFEPESTLANATMAPLFQSNANETFAPQSMSINFTAGGYWNLLNISNQVFTPWICPVCSSTGMSPTAAPFTPGVYTVAVADEWGQTAVLHFTVSG